MRRFFTILLSLILFPMSFSACEEKPDASLPSVTEEILKNCYMTVFLDRRDYKIGDVVTVTVTVENRGDERISLFDDRNLWDYGEFYEGDYSDLPSRLISVTFTEGGIVRNDLLPTRDYAESDADDSILEKNESISRIVEIYLDATSVHSAPAMTADWTVTGGVNVARYSENMSSDEHEYKTVEIAVPHERGGDVSYTVTDTAGCTLTAVLGKPYYTAIETVTADITFTNGTDVPVTVLYYPDVEYDFSAKLSRGGGVPVELSGVYSLSYEEYKRLEPQKSLTVPVSFSLDRDELGRLENFDPAAEYILSASVCYYPEGEENTHPRCTALEMPVPHERVQTQLYKEAKGAYFSRLRTTVEDKEYRGGDELPVTLEFFCIREDYYIYPFDERQLFHFKVQLLDGDRVVREELLLENRGIVKDGTVLTADTVFDTSGMNENSPWTIVFTVISCAEKDMEGTGFEEHSVMLDIPHEGYVGEEADE